MNYTTALGCAVFFFKWIEIVKLQAAPSTGLGLTIHEVGYVWCGASGSGGRCDACLCDMRCRGPAFALNIPASSANGNLAKFIMGSAGVTCGVLAQPSSMWNYI